MFLLSDEASPLDEGLLAAISEKAAAEQLSEADLADCLRLFTQVCNRRDELRFELQGFSHSYQLIVGDKHCVVMFTNGACASYRGDVDLPDITMSLSSGILLGLLSGSVNSGAAHMNGDIVYKGTKNGAVKLQSIFELFLDVLGV